MPKNAAAPAKEHLNPVLEVPTDLSEEGVAEISAALREALADVFALYVKTKNFHWHMTGRHFRDYHLLLDEHSDQIFAMTDDIAERGAQDRWSDDSFHQRYYAAPTPEGQQRGSREPERYAGRAFRRQSAPDALFARHA